LQGGADVRGNRVPAFYFVLLAIAVLGLGQAFVLMSSLAARPRRFFFSPMAVPRTMIPSQREIDMKRIAG
jgi:hypothetical protein